MNTDQDAAAAAFARMLGDLYPATIEPAAWTPALRAVADLLGATAAGLAVTDSAGRRVLAVTWEQAAIDEPATTSPPLTSAGRLSGGFAPGPGLAGVLTVAFAFHRPGSDGDASRLFDLLLPHVARAVAIAFRIDAIADRAANAEALLDELGTAVLVVDEHHRVLHASQAARVLLARGGPFSTNGGRLTAADRRIGRALDQAVEAATRGFPRCRAGSLAISPAGRPTTVARVVPLASVGSVREARSCAAIFVTSPGGDRSTPYDVIAGVHGLTRAERQVLEAIAAGQSPQDAAAALGVALSTVRTHLHRLFEKTGARRQSDLVRLVRRFSLP